MRFLKCEELRQEASFLSTNMLDYSVMQQSSWMLSCPDWHTREANFRREAGRSLSLTTEPLPGDMACAVACVSDPGCVWRGAVISLVQCRCQHRACQGDAETIDRQCCKETKKQQRAGDIPV
jgi:hypothetical protein